jgi:hypothetical protein
MKLNKSGWEIFYNNLWRGEISNLDCISSRDGMLPIYCTVENGKWELFVGDWKEWGRREHVEWKKRIILFQYYQYILHTAAGGEWIPGFCGALCVLCCCCGYNFYVHAKRADG